MPMLSSHRDRAAQLDQHRRRRAIEVAPGRITQSAHEAAQHQAQVNRAQHSLIRLEQQNPDFQGLSHLHTTEYKLVALLAVAVYIADVFLFRPVVQYIAGRGLPRDIGLVAVFVVPAIIVMAELGISTSRENARERARDGIRASVIPWFLLSWLFTVAMPALVVASYLASFHFLSPNLQLVLLVGLACLALGCHSAVIWGGPHALEAKSYLAYSFRHGRLGNRTERENAAYDAAAQAACQHFSLYVQSREQFNQGQPPEQQVPLPMFDAITIRTLNQAFGRPVIQTPPGTGEAAGEFEGSPVAQPPLPTPLSNGDHVNPPREVPLEPVTQSSGDPNGNAAAENDYLRTILAQRQQNEESEVKP